MLQTSQILAAKGKCFPLCCLLHLEDVAFVVIKCFRDVLTSNHPLLAVECALQTILFYCDVIF